MSRFAGDGRAAVPLCCAALRAFQACHGVDEVLARLRELLDTADLAERSALARARVAREPFGLQDIHEAMVQLALVRTGTVPSGGADPEALQRVFFVFTAAASRLGYVRLRLSQGASPGGEPAAFRSACA